MNITPDYLIERKKYKSQIRIWKLLVLSLVFLNIVIFSLTNGSLKDIRQNCIASIKIDNVIFEDRKLEKALLALKDDNKVKAVIVYINSQGGGVAASERLYKILRSISNKKPVVAVMGTMAASGGYMISLGANYIIAHNSTITGSIGIIFQTTEITSLAEKIGVTFNNFKSGELKAAPNPTEKLTPEVQAAIMATVKDSYEYFVDLIAERRKLPREEVIKVADGRIYTGRQAYDLKLVDAIGTNEDAVQWLKEKYGLDKDINIEEISAKPKMFLIDKIFDELDNRLYSMLLYLRSNLLTSTF